MSHYVVCVCVCVITNVCGIVNALKFMSAKPDIMATETHASDAHTMIQSWIMNPSCNGQKYYQIYVEFTECFIINAHARHAKCFLRTSLMLLMMFCTEAAYCCHRNEHFLTKKIFTKLDTSVDFAYVFTRANCGCYRLEGEHSTVVQDLPFSHDCSGCPYNRQAL